jgi:hypothetical protein
MEVELPDSLTDAFLKQLKTGEESPMTTMKHQSQFYFQQ